MGQNNTDFIQASGIKVLDRAVHILLTIAEQPRSLTDLAKATDLPRATTHRLATALEIHHLLTRTADGRWAIGPVLSALGAANSTTIIDSAQPIMQSLMETTQESVQLYQLAGSSRICIAALEPDSGLHNVVPVGSRMELTAGSAAKIFLAYGSESLRNTILDKSMHIIKADLKRARTQGWADSVSEREVGLGSVSAPVFDAEDQLIAVLSVSGPTERLRPSPGELWAKDLVQHAERLTTELRTTAL